MPIYEYYCPDCHMMLNFFARSITAPRQPACPHCGHAELKREVSLFAMTGPAREGGDEADDLPIDDARMERAMESLASEAEHIDENDPKSAAQLMRRFSDMTGLQFNDGMQEALQRMESGEDPEAIEAEMGDLMESEDPFVLDGTAGGRRRKPAGGRGRRLRRDPTLYDL